MNLFKKLFALTALTMTIFAACAENRQAAHNNGQEKLGTGDSGGGNLYKGRPIESYRVDITQHPAYKNKIAPIVQALTDTNRGANGKQMSHPDLGRMFLSILQKRTWYLIPGTLDTLPRERTGIAIPTDQGALQSPQEIWINSLLFNSMAENEQATLILHEILMGIRILKFASSQVQCLSLAPTPDYCDNLGTEPHGTLSQLTSKDYADVRAAGIQILGSYPDFSFDDWEDVMAAKNFSMSFRDFKLKTDQGEMTRESFITSVKKSFITKTSPTFGVKRGNPTVKETCSVSFEELSQKNAFELILKTPSEIRRLPVDLSTVQALKFYKYVSFNQKTLVHVPLMKSSIPEGAKVGDRYLNVTFLFDLDRFVGVEVNELVYTELTGQSSSSETPTGGLDYLCVNEPVSLE